MIPAKNVQTVNYKQKSGRAKHVRLIILLFFFVRIGILILMLNFGYCRAPSAEDNH